MIQYWSDGSLPLGFSTMPEELLPDGISDPKEAFRNVTRLFPYKPVHIKTPCRLAFGPGQERLASAVVSAQAAPPDGRISLQYHFHTPIWEAYTRWWVMFVTYSQCIDDELEQRRMQLMQHDDLRRLLLKKTTLWKDDVESFFSAEFKRFGKLYIHDIDPRTAACVSYDLNSDKPDILAEGSDKRFESYQWSAEKNCFSPSNQLPEGIAPWQRVIYCEGLCFTSRAAKREGCLPFESRLGWDDESEMTAANMHLSNVLRGGNESANPYFNSQHAFHVTFFERLRQPHYRDETYYDAFTARHDLKIGHLFGTLSGQGNKSWAQRGRELAFHRSSFTVIANSRQCEYGEDLPDNDWYWTMLILAPVDFFRGTGRDGNGILGTMIETGQASRQIAQLSPVVTALNIIEKRWREFDEYIGALLMEDFMDPAAYCQLLFDDSTFSRSRLYFWVLGCLNEFDAARVNPLLNSASAASPTPSSSDTLFASSPTTSSPGKSSAGSPRASLSEKSPEGHPHQFDRAKDLAWLLELDRKGEQAKRDLERQRAGFGAKKEKVIALRDGLFNASALIESRSSTRLGMNVQLLTYVSIFYLPLAFCAALWAIPNITDPRTQTPFIITAILTGFVTYVVVFNLENLAQLPARLYSTRKKRLLQQMEKDKDEAWRGRSRLFEEFPPTEAQKTPSEWWMVRYQLRQLFDPALKLSFFEWWMVRYWMRRLAKETRSAAIYVPEATLYYPRLLRLRMSALMRRMLAKVSGEATSDA